MAIEYITKDHPASTWGIPSPLDEEEEPKYEYPENYTGYEAPALSFSPYTEESKEESEESPIKSIWTLPSKLTSTTATTTSTTTPIKPTIPLPTFKLPERDIGRIRELRAEALSTPMRKLRQEARRALPRIALMEGPMAKEAYRGWTEGLGTGISSIASQATLQAEKLYNVERAEQIKEMLVNFQAELNDYFSQYGQKTTQTTTTEYEYGGSGSKKKENVSWFGGSGGHYVIM